MTGEPRLDPLAGAVRAVSLAGTLDPHAAGHLDDDGIAALAEGSLPAADRAAALQHVATCGTCRRAVASVARARADRDVARELAALDGGVRRHAFRVALPLAAAALLAVVVWPRPTADDPARHRAPIITTTPPPHTVAPVGTVAAASLLQWTAVDGADRYRVTLFDHGGRVAYETELTDTVAPLPDSLRLVPGALYLWKVEARTGFDRWVASELITFTVAAGR